MYELNKQKRVNQQQNSSSKQDMIHPIIKIPIVKHLSGYSLISLAATLLRKLLKLPMPST